MKTINLNKENCPYCDITLEITGDSDRSVFNWHLGGHGESLQDDEQISVLESEFNMNHIAIENPEWVKMLYGIKSETDKESVVNLICSRVDKLIKELKRTDDCEHQWEVTLTNKKQFNYCTQCMKCEVFTI